MGMRVVPAQKRTLEGQPSHRVLVHRHRRWDTTLKYSFLGHFFFGHMWEVPQIEGLITNTAIWCFQSFRFRDILSPQLTNHARDFNQPQQPQDRTRSDITVFGIGSAEPRKST